MPTNDDNNNQPADNRPRGWSGKLGGRMTAEEMDRERIPREFLIISPGFSGQSKPPRRKSKPQAAKGDQ
jgi:hypothetical protein